MPNCHGHYVTTWVDRKPGCPYYHLNGVNIVWFSSISTGTCGCKVWHELLLLFLNIHGPPPLSPLPPLSWSFSSPIHQYLKLACHYTKSSYSCHSNYSVFCLCLVLGRHSDLDLCSQHLSHFSTVNKTTSHNLWPRINSLINGFKKPRGAWFSFLRRQPRNFANVTLVARRREHFRGFWAKFLVPQLPPKRGVLVHKNSLASCQRCRHSVEPRALTCPFKQSILSVGSCQNL